MVAGPDKNRRSHPRLVDGTVNDFYKVGKFSDPGADYSAAGAATSAASTSTTVSLATESTATSATAASSTTASAAATESVASAAFSALPQENMVALMATAASKTNFFIFVSLLKVIKQYLLQKHHKVNAKFLNVQHFLDNFFMPPCIFNIAKTCQVAYCVDYQPCVTAMRFAITIALLMWSQMWSAPIRRSIPACSRLVCTRRFTPESTTWMPSFCDDWISSSRL